jgi:hypothetical protein
MTGRYDNFIVDVTYVPECFIVDTRTLYCVRKGQITKSGDCVNCMVYVGG